LSKRDRLGRGLGALLGEYLGEEGLEGGEVRRVAVAAISPNPFQPRRAFPEANLAELTESIRANGLLQPIVVRSARDGGAGWELVAGERRWRAVMRLGWREVPAIVREVDDRTLLVLAVVENLQRADLTPLEEAAAYQQLGEQFGLSHAEIAENLGRDRSTVTNALRLLQLPPPVRNMIGQGALTAGHARALLGVGSTSRLVELARRAAAGGWSVRETERRVRQERSGASGREGRRSRGVGDAAERVLEDALQRALGTEVRIKHSRGGHGRVEITFQSHQDFERLFELFTGAPPDDLVS
jgi:ParB family transcriptional regulator, chromosome partitioning protein